MNDDTNRRVIESLAGIDVAEVVDALGEIRDGIQVLEGSPFENDELLRAALSSAREVVESFRDCGMVAASPQYRVSARDTSLLQQSEAAHNVYSAVQTLLSNVHEHVTIPNFPDDTSRMLGIDYYRTIKAREILSLLLVRVVRANNDWEPYFNESMC